LVVRLRQTTARISGFGLAVHVLSDTAQSSQTAFRISFFVTSFLEFRNRNRSARNAFGSTGRGFSRDGTGRYCNSANTAKVIFRQSDEAVIWDGVYLLCASSSLRLGSRIVPRTPSLPEKPLAIRRIFGELRKRIRGSSKQTQAHSSSGIARGWPTGKIQPRERDRVFGYDSKPETTGTPPSLQLSERIADDCARTGSISRRNQASRNLGTPPVELHGSIRQGPPRLSPRRAYENAPGENLAHAGDPNTQDLSRSKAPRETTVLRRQCRNAHYCASTGRPHRRDQTGHGRKNAGSQHVHLAPTTLEIRQLMGTAEVAIGRT
jgi:hypothetical protein